jgi:hypothetical protein
MKLRSRDRVAPESPQIELSHVSFSLRRRDAHLCGNLFGNQFRILEKYYVRFDLPRLTLAQSLDLSFALNAGSLVSRYAQLRRDVGSFKDPDRASPNIRVSFSLLLVIRGARTSGVAPD